ncbi:hypothetical protein Emag_006466 [Eimeria magna]
MEAQDALLFACGNSVCLSEGLKGTSRVPFCVSLREQPSSNGFSTDSSKTASTPPAAASATAAAAAAAVVCEGMALPPKPDSARGGSGATCLSSSAALAGFRVCATAVSTTAAEAAAAADAAEAAAAEAALPSPSPNRLASLSVFASLGSPSSPPGGAGGGGLGLVGGAPKGGPSLDKLFEGKRGRVEACDPLLLLHQQQLLQQQQVCGLYAGLPLQQQHPRTPVPCANAAATPAAAASAVVVGECQLQQQGASSYVNSGGPSGALGPPALTSLMTHDDSKARSPVLPQERLRSNRPAAAAAVAAAAAAVGGVELAAAGTAGYCEDGLLTAKAPSSSLPAALSQMRFLEGSLPLAASAEGEAPEGPPVCAPAPVAGLRLRGGATRRGARRAGAPRARKGVGGAPRRGAPHQAAAAGREEQAAAVAVAVEPELGCTYTAEGGVAPHSSSSSSRMGVGKGSPLRNPESLLQREQQQQQQQQQRQGGVAA